jgi:hypothetical protein
MSDSQYLKLDLGVVFGRISQENISAYIYVCAFFRHIGHFRIDICGGLGDFAPQPDFVFRRTAKNPTLKNAISRTWCQVLEELSPIGLIIVLTSGQCQQCQQQDRQFFYRVHDFLFFIQGFIEPTVI